MPTKTKHNSPNTSKQHVSKSVLLLLGSTILSAGALFITSYISTLHYQQTLLKEDITFARIETFVDLAKLRLEQELPEGKWEIEKYCDLPNSKGTAATYSCSYGVVSSGMYQYDETIAIAHRIADSNTVEEYSGYTRLVTKYNIGSVPCVFEWSRVDSAVALSCVRKSVTPRYTETVK